MAEKKRTEVPETSTTLLRDVADSQHARWAVFHSRYEPMMQAFLRDFFKTTEGHGKNPGVERVGEGMRSGYTTSYSPTPNDVNDWSEAEWWLGWRNELFSQPFLCRNSFREFRGENTLPKKFHFSCRFFTPRGKYVVETMIDSIYKKYGIDPNRIPTDAEVELVAYCFDVSESEARSILAHRRAANRIDRSPQIGRAVSMRPPRTEVNNV